MGVKLGQLTKGSVLEIKELKGKRIAVDAFLWIHQFLSIIRQADGTPLQDSEGRVTSHLSGIFYRSAKLLEHGVKPIWVFDGKKPDFKYVTAERRAKKEEAKEKWEEAKKKGDLKEAKKYAQATVSLNTEMLEQAKELIQHMGMPVVIAPSEGEAQCAYMCKEKMVYGVASQDIDSLLFGAPKLLRNLSVTGKRKLPGRNVYIDIKPEIIELKNILSALELTREKLILMGLLVGTDFNSGIHGIGPKKSLKMVKEKSKEEIFENVGDDAEKIYNFFLNPPVKNVKINFPEMKSEKIKNMLVDDFEFSSDRIEKVLNNLKKSGHGQKGLGSWLK